MENVNASEYISIREYFVMTKLWKVANSKSFGPYSLLIDKPEEPIRWLGKTKLHAILDALSDVVN